MTERLYVFCYDVSDRRARNRIAKRLEDNAVRVQRSVFEARLTARRAKSVARGAARHLGPGDSLKVYAVGASGFTHCMAFGAALLPASGDYLLA